jgi:hypothetical protein
MLRLFFLALLVTWSALAAAQGQVYESKDAAGRPVYSDQPSPGARPLDLPPPSVIETPPLPQRPPAPAPEAKKPTYESLAVASPADGDTVWSNTGEFDVDIAVTPALRAAEGDIVRVRLDGSLLAQSYASTSFRVSEADWQAAANFDNIEHSLQLTIVDAKGATLIESAPVKFFVHRSFIKPKPAPR